MVNNDGARYRRKSFVVKFLIEIPPRRAPWQRRPGLQKQPPRPLREGHVAVMKIDWQNIEW